MSPDAAVAERRSPDCGLSGTVPREKVAEMEKTLAWLLLVGVAVGAGSVHADRPQAFGVLNQQSPALTAERWNPVLSFVTSVSAVPLQFRMGATKGSKGTGLGLATVYGIVKQSGGYIAVASEPGCGATFTIYLPRTEQVPEAAAIDPDPTPPRGSETVLLVEDEEGVRGLAQEILEMSGYRVQPARHAAQAMEICAGYAGPIHLVLTDVVMPGMSGPELVERLMPRRPDLRVLFMSGYTDDHLGQHGVLEPGVILLPKPFTPDVLARKVREALDGPSGGSGTVLAASMSR
jgi:CheY-like chemotaxis protein